MARAQLSKSRFLAGLQCPKQLWWRVHEPQAPELEPDDAQAHVFACGHHVGAVARSYVPGGVLIDLPHYDTRGRVAATANALAAGARVVYEAGFVADGVFVSVDILERRGGGFVLVEVKSTTDVKEEHLPDVAIQLHVLRRAGLDVPRAELMHLNRACRHPDLSNLFLRVPVTARLRPWLRDAPERVAALQRILAGPVPAVAPGPHCTSPYDCPFLARCWPPRPPHHVSTLYRFRGPRADALVAQGYETLLDLPADFDARGAAARQLRSVRAGELVVETGLGRALGEIEPPLAYLDFETVNLPIPVWPGCAPYDAVPVQMSCHSDGSGGLTHRSWLAEGPGDPRPGIAAALLDACAGAKTIVAYKAPFERRCIEHLAEAVPARAAALRRVKSRVRDLLPVVRDHVYHPAFGGSFSLKSVLPALVPDLGYDDLVIQEGAAAADALEALLFGSETLGDDARRALRTDLLRYCERDTLGLARLHARLRGLAGG
jgi:hypothetical protein